MIKRRRHQRSRSHQTASAIGLFLFLLSTSCTSPSSKPTVASEQATTKINFESFSQVQFGTPAQEIISRFGRPQKAFKLSDGSQFVFVYQNDPNEPARTSFGFDPQKKVLTGKTYEPRSEEKANSIKYLKAQFKDAEFYSPPISMCGSHYARNAGMIFVLGTGVQISVHPRTQEVRAISFGPVQPKPRTPAQLPDGCPKEPIVMGEEVDDPLSLISTN